jgi:quercetin dioxygenase-like cupin family protein
MAIHHAQPGEIFDLAHPQQEVPERQSTALFRTDDIEVIRRVLRAGEKVPEHSVDGDMTLQCLSGAVKVIAHGDAQSLTPGKLMYIASCAPYRLEGDGGEGVVLMTIVRTREKGA